MGKRVVWIADIVDERFSSLGLHKGYQISIDPETIAKPGDIVAWIEPDGTGNRLALAAYPGPQAGPGLERLGVVVSCILPLVKESLLLNGCITVGNVNDGRPIPLYTFPERPGGLNTRDGWNRSAREQNRRAFVQVFGREPATDTEVETWARSGFPVQENRRGNA